LQHELIFYFLFWLFAMTRRPLLGAAIWSVLILVVAAAWGELPRPWFILLALINVEFAFGMVAARMISTGTGPPSWLMLLGAALLAALFVGLGGLTVHRVLLFAVALMLVPIVRAGRAPDGAVVILLGDASYAIYLVHNPLIALLARFAPPHWAIAFIWFSIAGTAAGLAYHLLFERHAIAFLRVRAARVRRRWTGELEGAT
jgi:peptidoglycan/LPS O-acetylase OafA/YrhL